MKENTQHKPEELIHKYLRGEVSREERRKLNDWLKIIPKEQSASFLQEFGEVVDQLDENRHQFFVRKLQSETGGTKRLGVRALSFVGSSPMFRVAASIALFLALGLYAYVHFNSEATIAYREVEVPPGGRQLLSLSDGSEIWIRGNSKLKYPEKFTGGFREVELEGEAYFRIEKDENTPFRVKTGDIFTQVLGTEFNLDASVDNSTIEVSLITGKVKVFTRGEEEVLLPQQQLIYHKGSSMIEVKSFDFLKVTGWKDNILVLDNEPMTEAIKKLERRYSVAIKIRDKSIKNCHIKAVLRKESLESVLMLLEHSLGILHERKNGVIILYGEGC